MALEQIHTVIVGASMSGLACAACLNKKGIPYIIIEQQNQVAAPWRHHYERLHLHTNKRLSNLPYKRFGPSIPRYPSRAQVVDYLESYQREFDIQPRFNTQAVSIRKEGDQWSTLTVNGSLRSRYVIMATGAYGKPRPVEFRGRETFTGKILHSYDYTTAKEYQDMDVLVVGFGNSACEIAIDLYEQGARPVMSVRSPVNIIPRDIGGIPVIELSLLMKHFSPRVADTINAPLIKWLVGDLKKLGLKKKPYGPIEQISREGQPPVLDIGTVRHIRKGHIRVHDAIERIVGKTVYFKNGSYQDFDVIVAAIGYQRNYADFLQVDQSRFNDLRARVTQQQHFGEDGLYFCGYWISPTGQIREIASDAVRIAKDIAFKENKKPG